MTEIRYYQTETEEIARRMRELDARSSTFLRTPPPTYDPVFTSIFTTAFIKLGFSATIAPLIASAASAVAFTALTPGIQIVRPK